MANSREERRKMRINTLRATMEKSIREKGHFSYEKMIAMGMMEFPTARRTSKEYVDMLINLRDDWQRIGDQIIPIAKDLTDEEKEVLEIGIQEN